MVNAVYLGAERELHEEPRYYEMGTLETVAPKAKTRSLLHGFQEQVPVS